MTPTDPRTPLAYAHQRYERQVERIAADLRRMAERVEQDARISSRLAQPYSAAASSIVQGVNAGLMNMQLGGLITAAVEAEVFRAQEQVHATLATAHMTAGVWDDGIERHKHGLHEQCAETCPAWLPF